MIFEPDSRHVSHIHAAQNAEIRRDGLRPTLLILHYTGMSSAAKAIDWLARAESRVSCHYVIDEHGVVTQMVPEALRAWHAGVSSWHGQDDINSRSIGIEIQNPGHDHGYPDFPARQMSAVIGLGRDIVGRNGIIPEHVLAHSDVAPGRKIDPGEKFNWGLLAREGLGHWVRPSLVRPEDPGLSRGANSVRLRQVQKNLASYGYSIAETGILDESTETILKAFQLHFRPRRVDGRLDRSTETTLERLLEASHRHAVLDVSTGPAVDDRGAPHEQSRGGRTIRS